jgi:hypothetical protein
VLPASFAAANHLPSSPGVVFTRSARISPGARSRVFEERHLSREEESILP